MRTRVPFKNREYSRARFPPSSRGFLYYHQDPSLPPTATEIRFRLTPTPDPTSFSTGSDLLYNSSPWSIPLHTLVTVKLYAGFRAQLIADRLIDPALMLTLQHAWKGCTIMTSRGPSVIHALDHAFEIDLQKVHSQYSILTTRAFGSINLSALFVDSRGGLRKSPYAGRLLLRFERSPLPEHVRAASRPPVLVLRVLKVLSPIEILIPGYDMHKLPPIEGELLWTTSNSRARHRVLAIDMEKPILRYKDLRLLLEE
ncbi:hypothetical protein DXG03_003417 [Asterophora parasitica]|uniref:Uncharacterized protein n=1 Tax=Asterophora parasitica TaxID=117018 RepID=A0A9P7G392_9AGAR|nr:hypothetical protein DXG03_003417 [Asterophora parasitica]